MIATESSEWCYFGFVTINSSLAVFVMSWTLNILGISVCVTSLPC